MPTCREKVVLGMSGGVDSSVAAVMLQDMGFDVIGVTLRLYDSPAFVGETRTCCSLEDVYDAQAVASQLGIAHYSLDREFAFRDSVINEFINEYEMGLTPSPCVTCNRSVKIREIAAFADSIGAKYIATGHYVRARGDCAGSDGAGLYRAKDLKKDQTYFLSRTLKSDVDRLICPLGGYQKEEVRDIAVSRGLVVGGKKDSQDICFVPDGDYVGAIKGFGGNVGFSGPIRHVNTGELLGEHCGLVNYTIGQRKGVGVSYSSPLYVCGADRLNNTLLVGEEAFLYGKEFLVGDINSLVDDFNLFMGDGLSVKIRSSMSPLGARVDSNIAYNIGPVFGDNAVSQGLGRPVPDELVFAGNFSKPDAPVKAVHVLLEQPVRSITPGQVCAFYLGEKLIGGGKIIASVA